MVVMGGNSVLRGYEMGRLRDRWLIGSAGNSGLYIAFNEAF